MRIGNRKRRLDERGVTLLEVVVVVIILGLLAALVGPRIFGRISEAQSESARTQIRLLSLALDNYRFDNGSYPTTAQGLAALRQRPTADPVPRAWKGPYLRREVPDDPWGRPYLYRSPGEVNPGEFDLLSLGRDGQPGGEGDDADIKSWE